MARYFQAPVVEPYDYSFKYPADAIYKALQDAQKDYDEVEGKLAKLMDVQAINNIPVSWDQRAKDEEIKRRYSAIGTIQYDEQGNPRDLRGMIPQIDAEARRRAYDASTGGVEHALTSNLATRTAWQETIAKSDTIPQVKKWAFNKTESLYDAQGGIGQKDPNTGQYQPYPTFEIAPYFDYNSEGLKIASEWEANQIQTGNFVFKPEDGKFQPTQAYINQFESGDINKPEYMSVAGGRLMQTGTLQYAAFDEIFTGTYSSLANNPKNMAFMQQEAQAMGAETEEEIKQYIHTKLTIAAQNAASKSSFAKFDPKSYDDWMNKLRVQHKYDISKIEYEYSKRDRPMIHVGQGDKEMFQPDPSKHLQNHEANANMVRTQQEKMNQFLKERGVTDPNKLSVADFQQWKSMSDELKTYEVAYRATSQVNNAIDKSLEEKGNSLYDNVALLVIGPVRGGDWGGGNGKNDTMYNEFTRWLRQQYPTTEALNRALKSNELSGGKLKEFTGRYDNFAGIARIPSKVLSVTTSDVVEQNWKSGIFNLTGVSDRWDKLREKEIQNLNETSGGIELATTGSFMTSTSPSGNDRVSQLEKGTEKILENGGSGNFLLKDGTPFQNTSKYAKEVLKVDGAVPGSTKIRWGTNVDPFTGTREVSVSFLAKSGEKTIPQEITLVLKPGAQDAFTQNFIETGADMMLKAQADLTNPQSKHDYNLGAQFIGQADWSTNFANSGVGQMSQDENNNKRIIYREGQPQLQITLLENGNYMLSKNNSDVFQREDELLRDAAWGNDSKLFFDSRSFGNNGASEFSDLNAIYQLLGEGSFKTEHYNEMEVIHGSKSDIKTTQPKISNY